jgi:hypothetical protein
LLPREAAGRWKTLALPANAVTAIAALFLPWFALDAYEPTGWDATWWARVAVAAAVASMIALRLDRYRPAAVIAAVSVAAVAWRVIIPPDFGFAFDGLKVPVERQVGCWVALGSSLLALLASSRLAWWGRAEAAPPPAPQSAAAAP